MSYERRANINLTGKLYMSGSTVLFESTDGTINVEAPNGLTLDGDTTLDTGHIFIFPNDGTAGSGNYAHTLWDNNPFVSGNCVGWAKAKAGTVIGYIPLFSGGSIL